MAKCLAQQYLKDTHFFIEYWQKYEGSLYLIVLEKLTWSKAKQYCSNKEATLVDVDSRKLNDYINSQVRIAGNEKERFWIAAQYRKIDDKFINSNGSDQKFFNWAHGSPNQKGDKNCVEVRLDRNGAWNSVPCQHEKSFVCEKRKGMYISYLVKSRILKIPWFLCRRAKKIAV